jgi:transposase
LAKARKNSANSSKPPSSDIVKPKTTATASQKNKKRNRGAQPGHSKHQRQPFGESEVDACWDYRWAACPDCGGPVDRTDEPPRVIQQIEQMWTWCFRASLFTLFKIDPSRGSPVLLDVLGEEFAGVLGCDYFSAYHKYMRLNEHVLVQFCLAHLVRDIKFLVTHPDRRNRAYGRRVLKATRELFELFHRRDRMSTRQFERECEDAANELCGAARFQVPQTPEAQNLANRFWKHGESYVRFLTTPGVEPTNNLAEQAIRFVVIDRHVTQGSRSEAGQRWLERIWTAIATCTQQGRSVFEFLYESIVAHFQDHPWPSLLPDTS